MRIIIFLFLAMFISIGAFSKDRKPSFLRRMTLLLTL